MLTIAGGTADFVYDYGAQGYSALLPEPRAIEGGIEYFEGPGGLVITSLARVCTDSATGVPYPDTVTVAFSGEVYQGCGGDPLALLVGADWVVEDINSGGVVEGSRVSLAFDAAEGRIGGRSGCNAFGADYSVGGEGISFGPVMSTEMPRLIQPKSSGGDTWIRATLLGSLCVLNNPGPSDMFIGVMNRRLRVMISPSRADPR